MRGASLAVALFLPLASAAASPGQRPRVAVLDLAVNGASRDVASAASTAIASELDRLGAFQVIATEAIRSMLVFEKQRQMLGCADAACLSDVGGRWGPTTSSPGRWCGCRAAPTCPRR